MPERERRMGSRKVRVGGSEGERERERLLRAFVTQSVCFVNLGKTFGKNKYFNQC